MPGPGKSKIEKILGAMAKIHGRKLVILNYSGIEVKGRDGSYLSTPG